MGVVKRRVLRGLWRRLVGVGIFGPGLLGAPALPFARLCVARDLGGCEHDYPRWGGHTTPFVTIPRARRTGFFHRVGAF